jgi:hypothetical protein
VPLQVAALLQQLQEQEEREPGSKAVVFSSWPRVLSLVAEALTAHKVEHVSLAASSLVSRRNAILRCGALDSAAPCTQFVAGMGKHFWQVLHQRRSASTHTAPFR